MRSEAVSIMIDSRFASRPFRVLSAACLIFFLFAVNPLIADETTNVAVTAPHIEPETGGSVGKPVPSNPAQPAFQQQPVIIPPAGQLLPAIAPSLPIPSATDPGGGSGQVTPGLPPKDTAAPATLAGEKRPMTKLSNTGTVIQDGTITEDVSWEGEVLIRGSVTVAPQATLTILTGTVVRFSDTDGEAGGHGLLFVQGRLVVRGTSERPVLFTSVFAEPRTGDWQGLVFLGTDKKNVAEYCRIDGAKIAIDAAFTTLSLKNIDVTTCGSGLRCSDCLLVLSGGMAHDCDVGIVLEDTEADLSNFLVTGNHRGAVVVRTSLAMTGVNFERNDTLALSAESSRLAISSSTFIRNGAGIMLTASEGGITASSIRSNAGHGLRLAGSRVKVHGNAIEENGMNGLHLEDGMGIAWGNTLAANGNYDCYNAGSQDFRAIGNWWGGVNPDEVVKRIYDRRSDATRGTVMYQPLLRARPALSP